ncbi:DNA polymerase III, subunit gamma and tau [Candidatus Roizmanbacteria bacterium CG22_combo_CG10-13_8_21_14_all_38_20]|uniref:DNA polymerase III subunit gamma/tau n=1 Tax=Candidatus Roizmanbacteria bacterium CG22_combo_CG10-13_8_21_14_all_38_20 TaxID=1974862 RepID=A0A2H0BVU4_9BACT|nr:DNA polymerase III subunit gamma/tau [Candidatus Microgenomates bacterium]PIP61806.1 MAG: DNA polymerase III, subunit gamma and tau [Candidatus Roizmanbacteria bacterium CG22_combo_CG10-13_8_21_14_all_38_20]PJC31651.1 MAG: DNA polymerase III, subunit gamma and tau [Candidatus Roizmanbacteria bacterium CG_4_9_14_0_2_um_filter_38_17]
MYYLKYRPQLIDELDLLSVRDRLANILKSASLPHAFLFTGPRGAGKTSAARIIAKFINCKKRTKNGEPCNNCDSCISVKANRHMDVFEIDAASNRGIDQIRDLRDKIGLSPSSGDYKIYIIDEVHMLTKEAFNALLKTLEEPPKHAVFILATTEAHKLPETIKSRCIEVVFPKASAEEIVRSLKRVVVGEKLTVTNEVLLSIVDVADGSFRDATKILEEASSKDTTITNELLAKVAGTGRGEVDKFIILLGKKDASKLIEYINSRVNDGIDPSWLTKATLDALHQQFLASHGIIEIQDSRIKIQDSELIKLMRVLEQASRDEKFATIPQMPLELAVIDWCKSHSRSDIG